MNFLRFRKSLIFSLIAGFVLAGCANGPVVKEAGQEAPDPGILTGISWVLLEIRQGSTVIDLNRSSLAADNMDDFFSLQFTGENQVSGRAAPNRYGGPCTWGEGSALSFGLIATTRMLAFKEPDALKEDEFFDYLSRVSRWSLNAAGELELSTYAGDGSPALMVFGR